MNLLLLWAYLVDAAVTDCSNGASLFKLSSMSFSPDPPIAGQNSTLSLSMNVPSVVTGGTAKYSATYNFIPLAPTTEDLCGVVPSGCPIPVGELDTISTYPMDGSLRGSLTFQIEWKDLQDQQLLCVNVKTRL